MLQLHREQLRTRNERLCSEIDTIISRAEDLLWYAPATFPTGTKHNPDHTRTVEAIASMLMPQSLVQDLSDDELAILILSFHLHDLGMVGTEKDIASAEDREQVRRDHAIRIADKLVAKWKDLGFATQTYAEVVGEVCRWHRPDRESGVASWERLRESGILRPDCAIRLRVLASLIFAIDELHIGADRAPQREEDWLEIENPISRIHWQRHRCIEGPVPKPGSIYYQVRVRSSEEEEDLRTNVLLKAFQAVADTNAVLNAQGLASLNSIEIEWLRTADIRLRIVNAMSDLVQRAETDIVDSVSRSFEKQFQNQTSIEQVCVEKPSAESLRLQIRHQIDDAITKSLIRAKQDSQEKGLVLDVTSTESSKVFDLAKEADEAHVTLGRRFSTNNEFKILASEFGRQFSNENLSGFIHRTFGVDVNQPPNQFLQNLIRSTPSAGRVLRSIQPHPSILINRHLLTIGLLSAASFDTQRHPELMLEPKFRNSFKTVSCDIGKYCDEFYRFYEELALVGGYSEEQIQDSILGSKQDRESVNTENPVSLTVRQSFPRDLPVTSVSFAHLALAALRSGATVGFQSIDEAPIRIDVQNGEDTAPENDTPSTFTIGPGKPIPIKQVHLRGTLDIDVINRQVVSQVDDLNGNPCEKPFMVSMPTKAFSSKEEYNVTFDFYTPALTVAQLNAFDDIVSGEDEFVWEMRSPKGEKIGSQVLPPETLANSEPSQLEKSIFGTLEKVDCETYYPMWLDRDEFNGLLAIPESCRELLAKYKGIPLKEKPQVSSVFLRFANAAGVDFEEKFLGFQGNFYQHPP